MGMGYSKLVEEYRINKQRTRERLTFIVKTLIDQDAKDRLQSYNSLRRNVALANRQKNVDLKKSQFLKRILDKNFDKLFRGMNILRIWSKNESHKNSRNRKIVERICHRIFCKSNTLQALVLRHLRQYNKAKKNKMKGICNRIANKNTRMLMKGYNKLK